ncbi:MAG: orotidine-5'-phosphate decarboxylase [Thermoprotei archaeon]|nr:MAG: orotidine-5'-phosphate decarboxylase [Thermoprotei archaeon]
MNIAEPGSLTLIIALDPPMNIDDIVEWSLNIIRSTFEVSSGYKIGLPFILRAGADGVKEIARAVSGKLLIADLKLADIGYIMSLTARFMSTLGVNAIIAHGFVGFKGALEELKSTCDNVNMKLILVLAMSHPGASEIMEKVFDDMLKLAERVSPWGAVLPATNTKLITRARNALGKQIKILAPGVGVQGAKPGEALCAGADFEIVGRAITRVSNPKEAAFKMIEEQKQRLRLCQH